MRIFRAIVFAISFVFSLGAFSQECDLVTDSDAYISWEKYSELESFQFIQNSSAHWVQLFWFNWWTPWGEIKICEVRRSYIHFPADQLPSCVSRAYLRLNFGLPFPSGVWVEIGAVEWDGVSSLSWNGQPVPYWTTVVSVSTNGWVEVDVTEPVRAVISGDRDELAFVVKLLDESCPPTRRGRRQANFTEPCLRFEPCVIDVEVQGLEDFTVTQGWIPGKRYAPLGDLEVTVNASTPYEVRACYDVSPDPGFSADPVDIAYTWVWHTLPRCAADGSSYILLPCFSGAPGTQTCTFRVRVDLADLGDRAAGEAFTFTVRVWAVPE